MPPKVKQKLRYNWRARQSGYDKIGTRAGARTEKGGHEASGRQSEDTNALVLPSRPTKPPREAEDRALKRRRLSSKQRKRLMKVLEAKERKAKRTEVVSHLSGLCLPPSQMAHLLPSTSLSSPRHTHTSSMASSVEEGVRERGGAVRGWKVRRKRRRRRELRVEKETRAPRERTLLTESEEDDIISTSDETGGDGVEEGGTGEGVEESGEEMAVGTVGEDGEKEKAGVVVKTSASLKCSGESGASVFVQLQRPEEVQEARSCLPVVGEEGRVMEVVREAAVTVLCGETGSGKTTQLPQFFYEYGYTLPTGLCGGGMIAVTEPRRVAAVSMAHRVAYEMGLSQREVSYQIRHEGNVTDETVIKFMTDGVLLKEIEQDFLLLHYSVVIVDEAHERSVFTDILLGLLSRIIPLREKSGRPLKLVVMSATLRVNDFTQNPRLFPSPPHTISVESRQFPVTVHFNKRTPEAYLRAVYEKVCKIHRCLPAGHVLVFVTGRSEVLRLCQLLRQTFPSKLDIARRQEVEEERGEEERGEEERGEGGRGRKRRRKFRVDLDKYPVLPATEPALTFEEGEEEVEEDDREREREEWAVDISTHDQQLPLLVLPLFSLLSSERQAEVFKPVPEGVRLCVIATNIAETSITVPAIKYVVDSGKVKRRYYDKVTGISSFRVEWVSKASANQRAGRAGRTEPGHCYRLYSSAVFQNQFAQFSEPEICLRPVEDLVLHMKAMGIDRVTNFPFPTPPSAEALQEAEKTLQRLGALSPSASITSLGRSMAQFPVAPRYAKMLALGHQHGCLPYILTLVAALSVKELFMDYDQSLKEGDHGRTEKQQLRAMRQSLLGKGEFQLLGDLGVLLRAVGAWDCTGQKEEFCQRHGLRSRAMREVAKLRQQLTHTVNTVSSDMNIVIDPNLAPPTQDQARHLRQIVLSGLGDHMARKIATGHMSAEDKKRLRLSYQCVCCEGPVYLHHSSCLRTTPPEYVVYQELMEAANRVYMRGVMAVQEAWLPLMAPNFCTFSKPLLLPPPNFDPRTGTVQCHVTCTYGPHNWPLPAQEVTHPPGLQHYRLFALFLLQGKVCPQLAQFSAALLLPPVTMVKHWAHLHSQTDVLLKALVDREVCSRQALCEQWSKDTKYLLKAFSLWLPQSRHAELATMWPPL